MQFAPSQTNHKYEIKKSVFISYLAPMKEFKTLLKLLKKEHPKATHIVWAYRYFNEFDQIVENSNDDGEPKGCAGAPTLSVLRGEELIESVLLTVRYFGGTKLGTGGMVRAYTASAKEVIQNTELKKYEKKYPLDFTTPYSHVNRYEHYFKNEKIEFNNREFKNENILWKMHLTEEEILKFKKFKQNI